MVKVIFTYHDDSKKWQVFVSGVKSHEEATHALNAVILTCENVLVTMKHEVQQSIFSFADFEIIPVTRSPNSV